MNGSARQVLFALVFVAVGLYVTLGVWLPSVTHSKDADSWLPAVFIVAAVVCGVGAWLAVRTPGHAPSALVRETPPLEDPDPAARVSGHLYRGAPPPRLSSRRTSARATVLLVVACLAFTGTVLPFAVHLPRWVEAEVVLAAWWLTWAIVLAVLAYRGRPLDESHRLAWRGPLASSMPELTAPAPEPEPARSRTRWFEWLDVGVDAEGWLIVVAAAIVIGIGLAAAWVVTELAAPAVFFLAYLGIARALRRALVASHRGNALRSSLHGALWATAYVAPLAVVIALLHTVLATLATH